MIHSLKAENAEKGVLGGILLFNEQVDVARQIVSAEQFSQHAHQIIFRTALKLFDKRKAVDLVTLAEALKKSGDLDEVGGYDYLHEIAECVPHGANTKFYAGIVRDRAILRALASVCHDTLLETQATDADAGELVDAATAKLFSLQAESSDVMDQQTDMESLMLAHQEELDRRKNGQSPGVLSGFQTLDGLTNGFCRKRVYVIAARPGVGKTALLCKMLLTMGDSRPLFFSLEQPRMDVADRLVCISAGLGLKSLQRGTITNSESEAVRESARHLFESPMQIDDRTNRTVSQLTATARVHKRKHKTGIILIDYLQLIAPENRRAPEHEQVADISRGLLSMAKELDVPVVALAQMNREVDKRQDRRPKLSDLRGSGAIEQDAYLIAFLDVPSLYDPDQPHDAASLIIAKHRNGELGTIRLKWEREKVTFTDEADFEQAAGGFMSQNEYWNSDTGGFASDMNYGQRP